jgi:hypothetical protein
VHRGLLGVWVAGAPLGGAPGLEVALGDVVRVAAVEHDPRMTGVPSTKGAL